MKKNITQIMSQGYLIKLFWIIVFESQVQQEAMRVPGPLLVF